MTRITAALSKYSMFTYLFVIIINTVSSVLSMFAGDWLLAAAQMVIVLLFMSVAWFEVLLFEAYEMIRALTKNASAK